MNQQELLAWGRKESILRGKDLKAVNSPETLKQAQEAAKKRRKAVGLSIGQAADAVARADRGW